MKGKNNVYKMCTFKPLQLFKNCLFYKHDTALVIACTSQYPDYT